MGYQVDTRTSSLEAWERLKDHPDRFDRVITDMTMPKMTGEDLARNIIGIRSDIPIILFTGFSANMDEKKRWTLGSGRFCSKQPPERNSPLPSAGSWPSVKGIRQKKIKFNGV